MEALLALGAFVAVTVVAGRLVGKAIFGVGKRLKRRKWRRGTLPEWEQGVERAGGTISEAIHDPESDAAVGIVVDFGDVRLTVRKRLTEADDDDPGWTAEPYTELSAQTEETDLVFELRDWTRTVGLPQGLGLDEPIVKLDDRRFDPFITARANNEDLLRAWLERGELRNDLAKLRDYAFIQSPGQLLVARPGWEPDVPLFAAALRVTSALAARHGELVERFRGLARELRGKANVKGGSLPVETPLLELIRQGILIAVTVRVRPPSAHDGAPRLCTEIESELIGRDRERWVIYRDYPPARLEAPEWGDLYEAQRAERELRSPYSVLSSDPDRTAGHLTDEICGNLVALAPRFVLVSNAAVVMRLPGFEVDPEKIVKAIDVVRSLSGPATLGPYR